ncbi:TPA: hypothetical protein N0F65_001485 [Lagenidium giganteum]|uniref:Uncharacterized protein n=1 Tax=Lagenidium giganteum TaxID=4803 RepID=A0AAV2Z6L5_9STRA|nr:TPA: hypothetical protein N0F65_001485 [Lagenidium giganteum]
MRQMNEVLQTLNQQAVELSQDLGTAERQLFTSGRPCPLGARGGRIPRPTRSPPMCGFNAVTSMSEFFMRRSMVSRLASMPETQLSVKATALSPSRRIEESKLLIITGLNTFSSKWPFEPPTVTATWLPMT